MARILFHHRISSKDGQFVHLEELVTAFRARGHEVLLVGPKVIEKGDFGSSGGSVAALRRALPRWLYEVLEFTYSIPAYLRLVSAIRSFSPDFVYERYNLFFPAGAWASTRAGVPLALEVNAPLYHERAHKTTGLSLRRLAKWSEEFVWQRANLVLPVTEVLGRLVERSGVDPGRILVLHNGVNESAFRHRNDSEAKERLGLANRLVLGFAGFVRPWHGVDKVVQLMANGRLPANTVLLVVGDGDARESLEHLALRVGVSERVRFTGVVPRSEMPGYIAAFDVALQPAVTEYASPLKLIEYLAMGRAIVAPDQPNIKELLDHDVNALLFNPSNGESMASCLEMLCSDPALRARLSEAARDTIGTKRLRWLDNADRIVDRMIDSAGCRSLASAGI